MNFTVRFFHYRYSYLKMHFFKGYFFFYVTWLRSCQQSISYHFLANHMCSASFKTSLTTANNYGDNYAKVILNQLEAAVVTEQHTDTVTNL